jgi:predicted nucleic acid-binding Zn ribbon protein
LTFPIAPTAQGVAEHKHCEACGKSIGLEGRVCSTECVARMEEALKAKKRSVYIMMGIILLTLLFTLYGKGLFGGA